MKWLGKLYFFTRLANGLSTASSIFTKVMKPVFGTLLELGHENVAYIDDSLLHGDSYEQCMNNIINTMKLFDFLGLTIHPDKSLIVPVY